MDKLSKDQIKILIIVVGVILIIAGIWLAAVIHYFTDSFSIAFAGVLTGVVLIIVGVAIILEAEDTSKKESWRDR